MSRPKYETQESLERERYVADKIGLFWNVDMVKVPMSYRVDFAMFRGDDFKGFCELKCRNVKSDAYPDLILSAGKWSQLCNYAALGWRTFLIIGYTDGEFYLEVGSDMQPQITIGGRRDREDAADIEPMVRLPHAWFKRMGVVKEGGAEPVSASDKEGAAPLNKAWVGNAA